MPLIASSTEIERACPAIGAMPGEPSEVMVALTLSFKTSMTAKAVDDAIREITVAMKQAEPRVACVYVRPEPKPDDKRRAKR